MIYVGLFSTKIRSFGITDFSSDLFGVRDVKSLHGHKNKTINYVSHPELLHHNNFLFAM